LVQIYFVLIEKIEEIAFNSPIHGLVGFKFGFRGLVTISCHQNAVYMTL
jgi:hypothetical protein